MRTNPIFIIATDTGAGKTWVTASTIRSLLAQGINAKAFKPIACGLDADGRNEDISALLSAQNINNEHDINRYCYALPAAPSQASAAQGQSIDAHELVQWCQQQSAHVETCLIEGVGGLMTPITDTWLVSDWIEAMPNYDIWLVVNCKLGAINQTLLTLDKLKQMGRIPMRMFFNATKQEHNAWLESTRQAVEPFLHQHCEVCYVHFGDKPNYL